MSSASLCLILFCLYHTVSSWAGSGGGQGPQFSDNLAGYGPSSMVVRSTGDKDRFVPAICVGPCIQSDCSKKRTRWFYNVRKGGCRKFKGCVGSGNNFPTEESCEDLCENQDDPCRNMNCRDCEVCDGGRCMWSERLCPRPQQDSCSPSNCGGPCQFCNRGRCGRRARCITIGRTPPPPRAPPVDLCANVRCGVCSKCMYGSCARIPMCTPPRPPMAPSGCRSRCFGRCRSCVVGRCVATPRCGPQAVPFQQQQAPKIAPFAPKAMPFW